MELDYLATDAESDGDGNGNGDGGGDKFSDSKKSKEFGPGACVVSEDDWDCETKPRFSEMKSENRAGTQIERCYDGSQVKYEDLDDQFYKVYTEAGEKKMAMASKEEETRVPDYKSLLSEFDEYAASERISSGVSRALSYGFEVGDLVWGKVKSHPWWPGHILNEAFVSPSVRRMRRYGHVLVAFFGDCSYRWFDPAQLILFAPNVAEKSQQLKSSIFTKAVEEAMDEAGRRSALGLACKCRNPRNFRATNVQGYFAVDVPGYELQAVYSSEQIKKARDSFSSAQTLSFVKRCALSPRACDTYSIKFFQKKAAVFAFRRAVFEEFDGTYEEAFRARSAYTCSVKIYEPLKRTTLPPHPRGSITFQRFWHCLSILVILVLSFLTDSMQLCWTFMLFITVICIAKCESYFTLYCLFHFHCLGGWNRFRISSCIACVYSPLEWLTGHGRNSGRPKEL